jgi:hypothetical protein
LGAWIYVCVFSVVLACGSSGLAMGRSYLKEALPIACQQDSENGEAEVLYECQWSVVLKWLQSLIKEGNIKEFL